MTDYTTGDYAEHVFTYYNENPIRLVIHLSLTLVTGGGWLPLWLGWLVGRMIRGDWKEDDE